MLDSADATKRLRRRSSRRRLARLEDFEPFNPMFFDEPKIGHRVFLHCGPYSAVRGREPVPQDPFTVGAAIITGIEALSGASIGFGLIGGVSLATVVGTVAIGGLLAGASYALQKTLPKTSGIGADFVGSVNSPETRGSVRQSNPARRICYGQPEVGGAVSFLDDTKPPYLVMQLLMCDRAIGGIRYLKIGANQIPFVGQVLPNSLTANTILTPGPPTTGPDYSTFLRVCFRKGLLDQGLDPLLASRYPSLEQTFRQQRIATVTAEFKYPTTAELFDALWGQVSIPSVYVGITGVPVYDPRDPTQRYVEDWNDAEDVADAMATWRSSRVASLCQADWLGYPDGMGADPSRIRWDEIAKDAEFDGEPWENADGTRTIRHPLDGVVTLDDKPRTALEAMLTANRGYYTGDRGRVAVRSCRPRKPRFTITDKHLSAGFTFRNDKEKRQTFNIITATIPSQDRNNQDIDVPVIRFEEQIEEDGEELRAQVRLPFTKEQTVAQRLAYQYGLESRLPRGLSVRLLLKGGALGLEVGDCVAVYSVWFPMFNGEYTIEEMGLSEDVSLVILSLAEYDSSIPHVFNSKEHELPFIQPTLTVS